MSQPTVIYILLFVIMLLCMTPPILWFWMNTTKIKQTYSYKVKQIVFWSWWICLSLIVLLVVTIILMIYL